MNGNQEYSTVSTRLILIAISAAFAALPQILWNLFGYQGLLLVFLESLFIILSFVSLLSGLMSPLPSQISRLGSRLWAYIETVSNSGTKTGKLAPIGIIAYALYLLVPRFLSSLKHYVPLPLGLEFLLVATTLGILLAIVFVYFRETKRSDTTPSLYFLPIAALTMVWAFAFWYGSPLYPTDEMLIDYFSAHLAISGINPYLASSTAGVFDFAKVVAPGFPLSIGTPLLYGGLVKELGYPAMAVLSYVPAQFFNLPPTSTLLPIYAFPAIFIFYVYSKGKRRLFSLFPVFILLLNPSYLIQTALGYPDIVWVSLMMVSIFFHKRPALSGLSMGLALAVKQIPWVILPFMLILVYRETGRKRALVWSIMAFAAFLAPNLAFIVSGPTAFANGLLSPELNPLIGVGFGPSQIGFLGILPLSRSFFTVILMCCTISFIIIYAAFYDRLKYAFLAFPILIFIFNYRFLSDYIVFWPIIALIIPVLSTKPEEVSKDAGPRRIRVPGGKKTIAVALAVLMIGVPAAFQETHSNNAGIDLGNIAVVSSQNSNITALSLNLEITHANLTYDSVLYRIVPWASMPNLNGYLWHYRNLTIHNNVANVTIVPDNNLQQISFSGKYRVIAYYGSASSASIFTVSEGKIS